MAAAPILPPDVGSGLTVASISVNATGTVVAALACTAVKQGDSRVFAYHIESGNTMSYDFAPEHAVPSSLNFDLNEPHMLAVQTQVRAVWM